MANKFYAVAKGRKPGIYNNWSITNKQVNKFPQAIYKSFKTYDEAHDWYTGGYKKGYQYRSTVDKKYKAEHNRMKVKFGYDYQDYDLVLFSDGGNRITGNIKGQHINSNDPSAWAYELIYPDKTKESDSYGYLGKTNNAMEISGLINGLQTIIDSGYQHKKVLSVMDSKYVINSVNQKWIDGWKRDNWTRHGQPLKNAGLWKQLYVLLQQMDHLDIMWVKGHTDKTDFYSQGNQDVDTLLNKTMDKL